jgi:hypothetical protein
MDDPLQIGELFGTAFILSALNGFRKTATWPIDPTASANDHFLPAETTNISVGCQDMPVTSDWFLRYQRKPECSTNMKHVTLPGI